MYIVYTGNSGLFIGILVYYRNRTDIIQKNIMKNEEKYKKHYAEKYKIQKYIMQDETNTEKKKKIQKNTISHNAKRDKLQKKKK